MQDKFLTKYKVEALQQVGLEGFWGIIITACFLVVSQIVPCTYRELCPSGHIEDSL